MSNYSVSRNSQGAYVLTCLVRKAGQTWYESQQFYYYTKKEAIAKFRLYLREQGFMEVPE